MNDPIPIIKETTMTNADDERRKKNGMIGAWVIVGFIGLALLSVLIPLSVWLTRLALGG